MAAPLRLGWVRIQHPDVAGTGDVLEEVFDSIWASLGWEVIESNPVAAQAPPRRPALSAQTFADLPDASTIIAGTVAVVGTGGAVTCYEQTGGAWDPLSIAGDTPSLPFDIVVWDTVNDEWPASNPDAVWKLYVSTMIAGVTIPTEAIDPNMNDGDGWLAHEDQVPN